MNKLEELQKLWKAIYKEKKSRKEKRMKLLILEGLHGDNKGKKMQWRLKYSHLEVGDRVVLNCHDWKVIKVVEKKKVNVVIKEFAIRSLPTSEEINALLESLKQTPGNTVIFSSTPIPEEKKALSEFRKRPYLKVIVEEVKGKPWGEENLEKIKFPCWCSYNDSRHILLGQINKGFRSGYFYYQLATVDHQYNDCNIVAEGYDLDNLIENYNIEILKGELHLWKEVGEYTKKKE